MSKNSARGGGAPAEEDPTNTRTHTRACENYIDERGRGKKNVEQKNSPLKHKYTCARTKDHHLVTRGPIINRCSANHLVDKARPICEGVVG